MSSPLVFPQSAIVGSLGELARCYARGNECPEEFYFATALTLLGSRCARARDLRLEGVGLGIEPRLYTILLGASANAKKSTAVKLMVEFFQTCPSFHPLDIIHGAGSGEGLARELESHPTLTIIFDELAMFLDKTQQKGSVLLGLITSLYEQSYWSNPLKDKNKSITITDGHLSLIACSTCETFDRIWTRESLNIGILNRLFLVKGSNTRSVSIPRDPNPDELAAIRLRIEKQLGRLPLTLDISPEAKARWDEWYLNRPKSQYSKRLDIIGIKLWGLIALITDKSEIDKEVIETVIQIIDYEFELRKEVDPIDADNEIAKMQGKIRNALSGELTKRELQRKVHYEKLGIPLFKMALDSLIENGEVGLIASTGKYHLNPTGPKT